MATPLASYGVFLPILAERFGGVGAISAALLVNLLVGGVAGFAVGSLADRYGPRLILVVTVGLAGAAFALVSPGSTRCGSCICWWASWAASACRRSTC